VPTSTFNTHLGVSGICLPTLPSSGSPEPHGHGPRVPLYGLPRPTAHMATCSPTIARLRSRRRGHKANPGPRRLARPPPGACAACRALATGRALGWWSKTKRMPSCRQARATRQASKPHRLPPALFARISIPLPRRDPA
jgi:hypothetical protein